MGKPKVNPHRKPATQADVNRMKHLATTSAITLYSACVFTVLHDDFGFEKPELLKVKARIDDLCDSMNRNYIKLEDLIQMLEDECGLKV